MQAWDILQLEEKLSGALDCYWCGFRCDEMFPPDVGGFDSFQRLAQHTRYCPKAPLPHSGEIYDLEAARILAANRIADERMRGNKAMSKRQWTPPAPSADAGDDLPGFLGAKNLGKLETMQAVKLTGFQELPPSKFHADRDRFGLQVIFQRKTRVLPIEINSVNHRILGDLLGKPKAWIGKKVTICARKGKFPNPFVAIER